MTDFEARLWAPGRPLDLHAVIGGLRRGSGDPTFRVDTDGTIWRGIRTPDGPSTLRLGITTSATDGPLAGSADGPLVGSADGPLVGSADGPVVEARAWGPGAAWVLASVPDMLGRQDDPTGFVAHHPLVAEAARRFTGWHVPRTRLVLESLVPSIIEQKVSGREAFGSFRTLIHRYGERAPGEGAARGLWVAPDAAAWARIPSWEWLRAGVDGARSAAIVRAAGAAGRLEQCAAMAPDAARRRLMAVPGVGVWTAAEVRQTALGDADAVSFGDYHVARNIGWALTGSDVDDDGLAELLKPYAGHRYRVQKLLELAGATRPRRGPRMPVRTHLPHRFR